MKRLRMPGLQVRIVLFFTALLVAVQVAAFVLVNEANSRNVRAKVEQDLATAEIMMLHLLDQHRHKLERATTVLAADFGFRQAVASADQETVHSALVNHGARVDAEVAMLVSLDDRVIADSQYREGGQRPFPFASLTAGQDPYENASAIVRMRDGQAYHLTVVPVLTPAPSARLAAAFRVDDRLAFELKGMSPVHVSFAGRDGQGKWTVLASTLTGRARTGLGPALDTEAPGKAELLRVGDAEFGTRMVMITGEPRPVAVVLQRSIGDALAVFDRLPATLVALGLVSLALSVLGSVIIARGVTRPLSRLAEAARRLQAGDYSTSIAVGRDDEVGDLAASFDHMRAGIAQREAQILRLAQHDSLTGLPNRVLFQQRLEETLAGARDARGNFTLFMLDLDRFKWINDTLGHDSGDEALRAVARRLSHAVRGTDTVARLGGDEFAILLPGASPTDAVTIARKVSQALEEVLILAGQVVDVGCSIGASTYPLHGDNPATLLRHADLAMYQAKRNRSGFVAYREGLEPEGGEQLSMLSALRQAVERDELVLEYQPRLELASGRVSGAEALVRWRHPERGMLPPGEFIPFAEQSGYIREITRWVLERALKDRRAWQARGHGLAVAVNIAARDLTDHALLDYLRAALRGARLPAGSLCLEITESSLLGDPAAAREMAAALRAEGVRLAIDDFGTGYSSLSYLRKLAVDEIKIDRSFVSGMTTDERDHALVKAAIELGHSLGLKVTAEGVEREDETRLLRSLGCDELQGYGFCPPLEPAALLQFLEARAAPAAQEVPWNEGEWLPDPAPRALRG